MPVPHLTRRDVAGRPAGLVLMLHGGMADSLTPVGERSASWHRSRWMLGQIRARLNRAGVSAWLLRYQVRGWNAQVGSLPSPVADARWALAAVRRELGSVPVVLLGHSMGGRVAVAVADDDLVTGVVALAPWLPADEPVGPVTGKHLAAAHGSGDTITSARQTEGFVRRAGSVAASAEFLDMGRSGHYMFRRTASWNGFAASRAIAFVERAEGR